ncbi:MULTISPECIES: energy-coupling factor ABC transporter substrate-binding protein [unclassified Clostridium]|uniref:energy-coupling factor ABC transporter substrate-binding protein n=1 Tax=unclassified Clostridium TaxID=2614128 RepID=UPI00052D8BCA|nr:MULTISPECIES: energy-coupling factor ABC transporter substrate-binding protein [unclassified Clostridium]KGK86944.1 cobalamin biosynthesis protein CbiN [Clostridium sp. HMP27]
MKRRTLGLITLCIAIIGLSLLIGTARGGEFGGADGQIEEVISEVNPNYTPWFESVWTPPSGEIESLLFAAQASIGAGFMGYYIGKKKNAKAYNGSCQKE